MPIATIDSPNATSSRRPCRSTRCPPRKMNPDSASPRSRWVSDEETKVRTIGTSQSAYAAVPPINAAARIDVAPTKLSGTKPSVPRPYAAGEHSAVHDDHDEESDGEGDAIAAECMRHGERAHEEPGHPGDQQQAGRGRDRGHLVGEPHVAAVHPEEHDEDQHDLGERLDRQAVLEQRRQLGHREHEHQVEEELEGRDARAVVLTGGVPLRPSRAVLRVPGRQPIGLLVDRLPAPSRKRFERVQQHATVLVPPRPGDRTVHQEGREGVRRLRAEDAWPVGLRAGSRSAARGPAGWRPRSGGSGPEPGSRRRAAAHRGGR